MTTSQRVRASVSSRWIVDRLRAARNRFGRLQPQRLPLPYAGVAMLCWLLSLSCAVAMLVPGLVPSPGPSALRVIWWAAGGGIAIASTTVGAALLSTPTQRHMTARAAAASAWVVAAIPGLAVLADGSVPLGAFLVALWLISGTTLLVAAIGPSLPPLGGVAAAAPLGLCWLAALVHGTASPSETFLWFAMGTIAVPLLSIGAFLAVARVAEERHARVRTWLPTEVSLVTALLVLLVKATLIWSRLTWSNGLFGPLDSLWTLRGLPSWPHAIAVALLLLFFAVRSDSHPLRSNGQWAVTIVLVLAGASVAVATLVDGAAELLRATQAHAITGFDFGYQHSHWAAIAAVLALSLLLIGPGRPGTAGTVMSIVALVYLIPPVTAIALLEDDPGRNIPTVWASAVQVDIALTAIVGILLVASLVRRRHMIMPGLGIRLLVVPFLVLHAGATLPAAWTQPIIRPLVVVGAAAALLFFMPPAAADAMRHSRAVLAASALQLTVLIIYLLSLQAHGGETDTDTLLAVLWLAVPISAVLCCRVTPTEDARPLSP